MEELNYYWLIIKYCWQVLDFIPDLIRKSTNSYANSFDYNTFESAYFISSSNSSNPKVYATALSAMVMINFILLIILCTTIYTWSSLRSLRSDSELTEFKSWLNSNKHCTAKPSLFNSRKFGHRSSQLHPQACHSFIHCMFKVFCHVNHRLCCD